MTLELGWLPGPSALLAATATVVGAILFGAFVRYGDPWGQLGDAASVVVVVAMIPVAIALGRVGASSLDALAGVVTAIGIVGMVGAAATQAVLVVRRRTTGLVVRLTLVSGVVIGIWYLLVGVLGYQLVETRAFPWGLMALAVMSGIGHLVLALGLWRGGARDPMAVLGGAVLAVGSTAFLGWVGFIAISGPAA